MSAIKDIHDLLQQLLRSAKEREHVKDLLMFVPLMSQLQGESFAKEEKILQLREEKFQIVEENSRMKQRITELENETSSLKLANSSLEKKIHLLKHEGPASGDGDSAFTSQQI